MSRSGEGWTEPQTGVAEGSADTPVEAGEVGAGALSGGEGEAVGEADADAEEIVRSGLRRWMTAYAAASSTTASFETIRDAATGGQGEKPAKSTTIPYRDALERLWLLDPVEAWLPTSNRISRFSSPPRPDGRFIAIEVKLTRNPGEKDCRRLRWLDDRVGDNLLDAILVTTGPEAYRRSDGIGVVPAALLGP